MPIVGDDAQPVRNVYLFLLNFLHEARKPWACVRAHARRNHSASCAPLQPSIVILAWNESLSAVQHTACTILSTYLVS
jgi:hypothetical protein